MTFDPEGDRPLRIEAVAAQLGLVERDLEPYGRFAAKLCRPPPRDEECRGRLILVTAMTPPPAGVGKTVTSIALGQALGKLGVSHCVCLRQPSLGPSLGMKGGAAGGERARLLPTEDINLHFTGDFHAVTSAHNLLAALLDNHVHFGNELGIDPEHVQWPRVLDLCDRQLRHCQIGLGKPSDGFAHPARFEITAASEVMAALALARDRADLEQRLGRMLVARDRAGKPVPASSLSAVGALLVLLRKAMLPNLVQTLEHTPALVHCGPFANIAHGASSVAATRAALALADYVITEAGFATELGAEKFMHLKCRPAKLVPRAAVLVLTCPALRYQGGAPVTRLRMPDLEALSRGLANARRHIDNLRAFNLPVVVALNAFPEDSQQELHALQSFCDEAGVDWARSGAFAEGGAGALELAQRVRAAADATSATPLRYLYEPGQPLLEKIEAIARRLYGADGVDLSDAAARDLEWLEGAAFGQLPPCIAKTPYSLSERADALGVPRGFRLQVRALEVAAGAGFVVVHAGAVVRMPGMQRDPRALQLALAPDGRIVGLA